MFEVILDFLSSNVLFAFTFIGSLLSGGIGLIYVTTPTPALTELGQLWFLTSLIGLGLWGLNYVRDMIPFTKMGKH
jgi:hypothetical protein